MYCVLFYYLLSTGVAEEFKASRTAVHGERLSASHYFASGPLSESSAENLSSRALREQFELESIEHRVPGLAHAEIGRTQLRQKCAQRLWTHAGSHSLRSYLPQQRGAHRF